MNHKMLRFRYIRYAECESIVSDDGINTSQTCIDKLIKFGTTP